jgi:phage-related protein
MSNTVTIIIDGKDNASAAMDKAKASAGGLSKSLGGLASVAGGVGLEHLGEKVLGFGEDALKAAEEAQAAQAQLKTAVDNTGTSYDSVKEQIQGAIDAGAKYGFAVNDTRFALTELTQETSSSAEALSRLSDIQDLARGTGMSLANAAKLGGKVTDENVNVFKRYGISVEKGATAAELFTKIHEKFHGQSAAFANTAAGQMERAKIQFEELKVHLGEKLLPIVTKLSEVFIEKIVPAIGSFIEKVSAGIDDFRTWADNSDLVQDALGKVADVLDTVTPKAQEFIDFLKDHKTEVEIFAGVIGAVLVVAFTAWAVSAGLAAAATLLALAPVLLIGAALGLLGVAIFEVVQHWDTIKEKTLEVVGFITDFITEHWKLIVLAILGPIGLIVIAVVDHWDAIQNKTVEVFDAIKDKVMVVVDFVSSFIREHWETISAVFDSALSAIVSVLQFQFETIKTIVQTAFEVVQGIFKTVMALIDGDWGLAWDRLKGTAEAAWNGIVSVAKGSANAVIGIINSMIEAIDAFSIPSKHIGGSFMGHDFGFDTPGFDGFGIPQIPYLANGIRNFGGGLAVVGENGPELVNLPRGANVFSNRESRGAGGIVVNVGVVNASSADEATQAASGLGYAITQAMRSRGVAA